MFVVGRGAEFALDSLFPVWAIASDDSTLPAVIEAVERARDAGATIIASGSAAEAIVGAQYVLASPPATSPLLAPLLSIVPGQLFAGALARARGLDPDTPRGLSKVTLAR
jgi:glucosamine--fructose-6-phosphate aminotransferase (isomerizing)